jgi:YebC/PmpR family DNA-binding regulatory protein
VSGHSKWAQIKRKKAATDERRGRMFGKLLRAIEVAAREGGPSIDGNMTLASAVQKAKDYSVPMDNIERAIKRGAGGGDGAKYEEMTYEGYGPGGVAILVEVVTDNRNRTGQEVRYTFSRLGGNLGDPGSVAWMFDRKGLVTVDRAIAPDEDALMEIVLESGAEDLRESGDQWEVVTPPQALTRVRRSLEEAGVQAAGELTMLPRTSVPLDGARAQSVLRLVEALEDLDDVHNVFANFDIPEELLAETG